MTSGTPTADRLTHMRMPLAESSDVTRRQKKQLPCVLIGF
jgi:hypothetical protein